jgi:rhodanese-related sulfurtransferase
MSANSFERMTIHQLYPRWLTSSESGKAFYLIDVRTPEEYARAHVPGALLKSLDHLDVTSADLPKQADLHLICHSGMRSQQAAKILAAKGFTHLFNIEGGTVAWAQAGYPVES